MYPKILEVSSLPQPNVSKLLFVVYVYVCVCGSTCHFLLYQVSLLGSFIISIACF